MLFRLIFLEKYYKKFSDEIFKPWYEGYGPAGKVKEYNPSIRMYDNIEEMRGEKSYRDIVYDKSDELFGNEFTEPQFLLEIGPNLEKRFWNNVKLFTLALTPLVLLLCCCCCMVRCLCCKGKKPQASAEKKN